MRLLFILGLYHVAAYSLSRAPLPAMPAVSSCQHAVRMQLDDATATPDPNPEPLISEPPTGNSFDMMDEGAIAKEALKNEMPTA